MFLITKSLYILVLFSFSVFVNLVSVKNAIASFQVQNKNFKTKEDQDLNSAKSKNINETKKVNKLLNINLKTINNTNLKLSDFAQTKVFLIVNTASKCGFTKQYEGLENLYKKYKDKGLAVIGFPSNDFGSQEPGSNSEIQKFCKLNFGITFPLMTKDSVIGPNTQAFYKELISLSGDKTEVRWNFEKFLVSKNGEVIERYKSKVKPEELDPVIETLLK